MNPAISIRDLHKAYRNGSVVTPVLNGVNLDIAPGELFFITGPSGCGKTTLVSVLCGTLNADAGHVEVLGHNLRTMSANQLARFRAANVGFVFQQFNLIPSLTITENVAVPLRLQPQTCSTASASAQNSTPDPPRSPAVSSSASPSPAPSSTNPLSSSATNPPQPSTPKPVAKS